MRKVVVDTNVLLDLFEEEKMSFETLLKSLNIKLETNFRSYLVQNGLKYWNRQIIRYNNSHKASLYLASGFPLVVWKQSALSSFVLENQCGIAVESLHDLAQVIEQLTQNDYQKLLKNVRSVGQKIRKGNYLLTALSQCEF